MTGISRALLKKMWPSAAPALVNKVADQAGAIFDEFGINTPLRVAHFMAQISHESGGGTVTAENMNYTSAARIAAVWPSRFTVESAKGYVRNPGKLASKVYNGRMGNRAGTDDGYRYRGRGLLQLTGRAAYIEMGKMIGLDLEGDPDLAFEPGNALRIAAAEFKKLNCLPACDADDVRLVTRRVNGGYNGLDDRKWWLARWKVGLRDFDHAPRDERAAMEVIPRGADAAEPEKSMLASTEGNAALGGGALGLLSTASGASDAIKNINDNASSAGLFDVLGRIAGTPAFWIGVAIIAVCAYLWFRRRWRLRVDLV